MANLIVERALARYHLSPSQAVQRRRLDSILGTLFEDSPDLLDDVGLAHSEICIRDLRVVVPVRLNASDATLTRAWANAIGSEVRRCVSNARAASASASVVRYRSRTDAVLDLVRSVTDGNTERAWAWAQLGLIGPGAVEANSQSVITALISEPPQMVSLLVELARSGDLPRLGDLLTASEWWTLASTALGSAGSPHLPARLLAVDPTAGGRQRAASIAIQSQIWQARPGTRDQRFVEERGFVALGILATLEVEPALLVFDPDRACDAVAALVEASARGPQVVTFGDARESGQASLREHTDRPAQSDASGGARDAASAAGAAATHDDLRHSPMTNAAPEETHRPPDVHRTRWGGLPFLLHLVDRLRVPQIATTDEALRDRPLDWVLHALAQVLAPVAPSDPAALAFAGLRPESAPPRSEPEEPSPLELAAIERLRSLIVENLRDLLERRDEEAESLVIEVIERDAWIDGEPGWVVMHLPLSDVSTEIRRAGLDLDLGYLPWLGIVISFAYE